MGNLIRKTKAAISCKEKSTTVVSDVKNDPKKDTAIFVQVSSEELKERRIDLYPYLIWNGVFYPHRFVQNFNEEAGHLKSKILYTFKSTKSNQ